MKILVLKYRTEIKNSIGISNKRMAKERISKLKYWLPPIKLPASYFMDIDKLTVKFIWRRKRPRVANSILKVKNKVRRLMLPNFKTIIKLFKTVWYW